MTELILLAAGWTVGYILGLWEGKRISRRERRRYFSNKVTVNSHPIPHQGRIPLYADTDGNRAHTWDEYKDLKEKGKL